jgi:cytochrome P450
MKRFTDAEICTLLVDPHTYAHRDLYHAMMSQPREHDPLFWAEPAGYRPFWVLTKHSEITDVQRQPEIFLNAPRIELLSIEQERQISEKMGQNSASGRRLIHMDGEEHRTLRNLSQGWLMPANLKGMEEQINIFSKEHVDKLAAAKGGQVDFVTEVS